MSDATITGAICRLLPEGEGGGDALTVEAADAVISRYPYFSLPAAIALRDRAAELSHEERVRFTRHLARTATSQAVLSALLNEGDEPFYPDEVTSTPSTENAIDTFLSTYGNGGEDDEVLNRLIFNPTPDYAQLLAREEQQNLPPASDGTGNSHDDLLNRFIIKQKQQEGSAPAEEPARIPATTVENRHSDDTSASQQTDTSLLSESLAKIFIRQRQYERAYEIISQLSLKYPEKSVYFADQMRFLRKVINNRRRSAEKQ
ncbi:MAG: hypothetical protein K2L55_06090 [Muribaculaceae bacterium]|nr:hypothetical protein [Muribaculaceae bacterium]MDE6346222.1 hypothetical protein [Muribaculaceae bacterium]